ncbi:hypothetical protein [Cryobacterium arcticum]|uniref:ATP-dependent DNA ligase n=1 Tax=Cryobacterium arcticum TaxID=670052 RepID=A0A1B1BQP8_9MICO|nr:hypothetical protein [Cryobacterium arcticum]ANP74914.1 ATP-dependent DNA ligase [Cryobacterium arcticum]
MGTFTYNSALHITINDTDLAHLEAVIGVKFRAQESFYFDWTGTANDATNRTTVWLNPHISVSYRYLSTARPVLNPDRVTKMLLEADTPAGLHLVLPPAPQPDLITAA